MATLVESLRLLVTVVPSVEDIPSAIASAGVTPSLGPVDSTGLQLSVARRQVSNGDVVTVALPGARGTLLWLNRPLPTAPASP